MIDDVQGNILVGVVVLGNEFLVWCNVEFVVGFDYVDCCFGDGVFEVIFFDEEFGEQMFFEIYVEEM